MIETVVGGAITFALIGLGLGVYYTAKRVTDAYLGITEEPDR